MSIIQCGRFRLDLSRPRVMAIINLTDDSFSGDGLQGDVSAALRSAEQALGQGADMLDIGAESSRPGAEPVPEEQELERVLRFIEQARGWNVPLSVDTMKPAVMRAALAAGADMINDINAFRAPGAIEAVAGSRAGLCVMHMQGEPGSMQQAPVYDDVVAQVEAFLGERVAALQAAGVDPARIVLDPGIGFGKTVDHNLQLLEALDELGAMGLPLLVGVSRKSMIGALTGKPVDRRLAGSLAAALAAVARGAQIVRVHDVAETRDALRVWQAIEQGHGFHEQEA